MAAGEPDKSTIRDLAKRIAEIASDPVNDRRRELWRRLNGLEPVRAPVFINELPWGELIGDDGFRCEDGFCRGIEGRMRRLIYQWEHMPGDMVVDGVWHSPLVVRDSGLGLAPEWLDPHGTGSRQYLPIMKTDADIERLRMPVVTHDQQASERNYERLSDLIDDIMPVEKQGIVTRWCAPWDSLIYYWGVGQLYTDMYDRPELVHKGISRMMDCLLARLRQWEELNVLSVGNGNHRGGSNGLGITDDLPQPDCDRSRVRPIDQWGTATGQVFSEVSPDMHWEFCLQYEMRWLERFGLNNYGCCEPLHNKMDIARKIPRLRKISVSPLADKAKVAEEAGMDFVLAVKPNPSIFAPDRFSPETARAELVKDLEPLRGLCVEIVMKDVTTIRNDPPRLHEWARIATEVACEFAP